jgi:hypothetical protein
MPDTRWTLPRLAVLTVLAAGAVQPSSAAPSRQESPGSPISGTWVANLEKSQRDPNHQFHGATMEFVVDGETVTLTYGGVNAGGQPESSTIVLQADGREHAVPGQAGISVVTRWTTPRLLHTVAKSGGTRVGEQSYEVSPDGTTLTARVSGIDSSGRRFEQVIVFDRK